MTEENATTGSPGSSETNAQAQGVQDELNALISEGATETKVDLGDIKKVVSYVQDQQTVEFNNKFRADMDNAVKAIQEAIPEDARKLFTPDVIEGHLYKQAEDSEEVKNAWLQRANNPGAWAQKQVELAEDFAKRFEETPDPAISEDREAVIAASKTKAAKEEVGDIMKISKSDFDAEQRKHGVRPYGT